MALKWSGLIRSEGRKRTGKAADEERSARVGVAGVSVRGEGVLLVEVVEFQRQRVLDVAGAHRVPAVVARLLAAAQRLAHGQRPVGLRVHRQHHLVAEKDNRLPVQPISTTALITFLKDPTRERRRLPFKPLPLGGCVGQWS